MGGITFSISMYIMCVCLFSALSRRVGALQISIIIIICQCTTAYVHGVTQDCSAGEHYKNNNNNNNNNNDWKEVNKHLDFTKTTPKAVDQKCTNSLTDPQTDSGEFEKNSMWSRHAAALSL